MIHRHSIYILYHHMNVAIYIYMYLPMGLIQIQQEGVMWMMLFFGVRLPSTYKGFHMILEDWEEALNSYCKNDWWSFLSFTKGGQTWAACRIWTFLVAEIDGSIPVSTPYDSMHALPIILLNIDTQHHEHFSFTPPPKSRRGMVELPGRK